MKEGAPDMFGYLILPELGKISLEKHLGHTALCSSGVILFSFPSCDITQFRDGGNLWFHPPKRKEDTYKNKW